MSDAGNGTSDVEIMQVIRDHYAPAVGTADIADEVGVTRQAAGNRLRNLHDDGLVEKYRVGQAVVWYLSDAGERYLEDI